MCFFVFADQEQQGERPGPPLLDPFCHEVPGQLDPTGQAAGRLLLSQHPQLPRLRERRLRGGQGLLRQPGQQIRPTHHPPGLTTNSIFFCFLFVKTH